MKFYFPTADALNVSRFVRRRSRQAMTVSTCSNSVIEIQHHSVVRVSYARMVNCMTIAIISS